MEGSEVEFCAIAQLALTGGSERSISGRLVKLLLLKDSIFLLSGRRGGIGLELSGIT